MEKNSCLLSIAIPTRNRFDTATQTIMVLLKNFHGKDFEIVISDNSDSNILEDWCENLSSDRVRYLNNTGCAMSTIDNFEECLGLLSGKYVVFIGDDDFVNPKMYDLAEFARTKDLKACSYKHSVGYEYPGSARSGCLVIHPFSGDSEKVDVRKEYLRFQQRGGVNYLEYKLPRLYHGLVSIDVINALKAKHGCVFGGLSPDIFASLFVTSVVDEIVYFDYPFSISGSSPKSNLTHRTKEAENMDLANAPHFNNISNYLWLEIIPPYYSPESIWAETGQRAVLVSGLVSISGPNLPMLRAVIFDSIPYKRKVEFLKSLNILGKYILLMHWNYVLISRNISKLSNRIKKVFRGNYSERIVKVESAIRANEILKDKVYLVDIRMNYD